MKITDVDVFQIHPRNQARNRGNFAFYGQVSKIAVYRGATDSGLVGYGETRGPVPPRSAVESVIGRDPFDFIGSNLNHGLVAALYDLMGKRLEVPAYKLMGQKRRDAVSLAAWTRPCSPHLGDVPAGRQRAEHRPGPAPRRGAAHRIPATRSRRWSSTRRTSCASRSG